MSLLALSSCICWKPSKFNLGHSPAAGTGLLKKDAAVKNEHKN